MVAYRNDTNTNNWRVLTFCLIIFQSIGIRFFSGQGTMLTVIVFALSFKSIFFLTARDYKFLFISVLFIVISKIVNPSFSFSNFIFLISLIISTYLFIAQYKKQSYLIQQEFFVALQIFIFHAIIGYILYLIFSNQFKDFNVMNKSFVYLFYVSNSDFIGLQRNTGLFWEPGVMQLAANLYLFYCITFDKKSYHILIAVLAVISSLSTAGLIILAINMIYFVYLKIKINKKSIISILLGVIVILAFVPIIMMNITNKFDEANTSGIVRYRDMQIGIELIKERPLIGHGVFDAKYLISKDYVRNIESGLFSAEYMDTSGEMGGGYTNGLLGLIACFGIPISVLLYLYFFKSQFVETDIIERILFNLIFLFSMLSEPIGYTSLFLMFPFSYWILKKSDSQVNQPYSQPYN